MIDTKITQKMASVILSCNTFDQLDTAITFMKLCVNRHEAVAEQRAILNHGVKLIRWKRKILKKKGLTLG